MRTGAGLALICVGAILAFAVTANTSVFNVHTAGWVLMIIGLIGLFLPRRAYGWLGQRTLVRRTRFWPGNRPVDEVVPVRSYVARNPGTSRTDAGLPPKPTLASTVQSGTGAVRPGPVRHGRRPVDRDNATGGDRSHRGHLRAVAARSPPSAGPKALLGPFPHVPESAFGLVMACPNAHLGTREEARAHGEEARRHTGNSAAHGKRLGGTRGTRGHATRGSGARGGGPARDRRRGAG